jgi:uncharacterized protein
VIEEIIKLREEGLSFRKIADQLDTTVGKVQYRWNKWMDSKENGTHNNTVGLKNVKTNSSVIQTTFAFNPLKGELQAKLVSPRKIILYWEVSGLPQKIIQLYFTQQMEEQVHLIRVYDVTDIIFNGRNAHHFYEIAYAYDNGYWFIKGLSSNRTYIAELGVRFTGNEFFPILRSNSIQTETSVAMNGNDMYLNLMQLQNMEDSPQKWIDHVSTYSFYEDSQTMEENDE